MSATKKGPLGHGVGVGVEAGHLGRCELVKTENHVKIGTEYLP